MLWESMSCEHYLRCADFFRSRYFYDIYNSADANFLSLFLRVSSMFEVNLIVWKVIDKFDLAARDTYA